MIEKIFIVIVMVSLLSIPLMFISMFFGKEKLINVFGGITVIGLSICLSAMLILLTIKLLFLS